MNVDVPTASRHAVLPGLLLALARGWGIAVGDIRSAFLNGVEAPRGFYFRQPRGIPTLEPGQIIEIVKGVLDFQHRPSSGGSVRRFAPAMHRARGPCLRD